MPTVDSVALAAVLMLLGGAVCYAAGSAWPFRQLGLLALVLGAALATARAAGPFSAATIALVGLALVVLLLPRRANPHVYQQSTDAATRPTDDHPAHRPPDRLPRLGAPPGTDGLGVPLRLLLVGFAAVSTVALVTGRPLGDAAAVDLNLAWYWTGGVGLLLLLGDRDPSAAALGGALVTSAVGLALLHLAPTTPFLALWALPPLTLAATARWLSPPHEPRS